MTEIPAPTVRPTRFEVSCLPPDSVAGQVFALSVEWRGNDRWAVLRRGSCLAQDGTWDYEHIPSERRDDWLDEHRFDLDTAIRLATEQAPLVTCNGYTITDVLNGVTPS